MSVVQEFRPRWASPPGDSIRIALTERRWDLHRLSDELEMSEAVTAGLLDGSTRVTMDIARRLAGSLGGTTRFWMARDARYSESRDWIEADRWVSLLPTREMLNLGWVKPFEDWYERIAVCMEFFGAESPIELHDGPARADATRYRAKPRTVEQDAAISAWVRKVEMEAGALACARWNDIAFEALCPQLRALSRIPDPNDSIPQLQQLCASAGVAVVVVRAPRGCPINGASMTLTSGMRAIGLSGRYLADDHLWFTFFHEAGHLIRHDPSLVFIDDMDRNHSAAVDSLEVEADHFAADVLLPEALRTNLPERPTPYTVHRLSKSAGVSPGIIVGQLQHGGLISFRSPLNRLKRRYRWEGSSLTLGSA